METGHYCSPVTSMKFCFINIIGIGYTYITPQKNFLHCICIFARLLKEQEEHLSSCTVWEIMIFASWPTYSFPNLNVFFRRKINPDNYIYTMLYVGLAAQSKLISVKRKQSVTIWQCCRLLYSNSNLWLKSISLWWYSRLQLQFSSTL